MNRKNALFLPVLIVATTAAFLLGLSRPQADAQHDLARAAADTWTTPPSIQREHKMLHQRMAAALNSGGATAEAAQAVRKVLQPHFQREEELAMPALSLLQPLARGELTEDMRPVIERMRTLRDELPEMLEEHKAIAEALRDLEAAARNENKPEHAEFARTLMLHAQHEEEVLYPAAILVGRHLELRFGSAAPREQ